MKGAAGLSNRCCQHPGMSVQCYLNLKLLPPRRSSALAGSGEEQFQAERTQHNTCRRECSIAGTSGNRNPRRTGVLGYNKSLAKEVRLKCIPRTCDKLRPPQSTRAPLPADYDVIAQAPPTTAGGLRSINGVSLALKKDVLIFNAILIEFLNAM